MKKIIGIMVSASVLAGTFVASLTASAAGQAGTSCNIKDYSTLYNCDFESGQTLSTKATLEDAATVTNGWTSEIVKDADNESNHVYNIHKNEQEISCFAVNIPLGSGIKAGTGKYVISYDLKVPGKSENHLIQLRASKNAVEDTVITDGYQLSIIKASNASWHPDTNLDNNLMTASYNKTSSIAGEGWWPTFDNTTPDKGIAVGIDYWLNVKIVIDTTNGKAEYYYNDEYCGTQTADEFKQGIKTLQLQSWQSYGAYGDLCIDNIKVQSECDSVISYDFTDGTIPANINGNNGAAFSDDGNNVLKLENASGGTDFMILTLNEKIPANSGKYVFEYDLKYFDVVYNNQSSSFYCQAICGNDNNWYPMNSVREWPGIESRLTYTVGNNTWDTAETGHNPNYSNWDNIRIIINTDNNTADYYFNDVYAGTQARTAGGNGYNTGINGFAFQLTSNTQNKGKVYIDNISLKKYNSGSFYVGNTSATNADGTATAKCVLINTGSASQKADLIIAGYDASGRFTGVNWKTVTAGTDRLITTDSVTLTGTTADAIVKPFVWNSIADGVKIDR